MTSLSPFNSILELFAGFNAVLFGFTELRKFGHGESYYGIKKMYNDRIKQFKSVCDKLDNPNFISLISKADSAKKVRFEKLLNKYFKREKEYTYSFFGVDKRIQFVTDNRRLISLFYYGFFYCLIILALNGFSDTYPLQTDNIRFRMHVFNIFSIIFIFVVSFHSKKISVFLNIAIITGTIFGQVALLFWSMTTNANSMDWITTNSFYKLFYTTNKSIAESSFLIIEVLIISFIPIFVCYFYPNLKFLIRNYYFSLRFDISEKRILRYSKINFNK